ncbi:MAG: CPBP family intramembrane metalloprotease [Oscillospiraceae bacterium]|nr:CPBP family intramembrane metalloprotease [Oscillospiraceae bacterium]
MHNINENNKNNRWNYTIKSEKIKFISTIHIISLAVVLQFLLFRELPEIIYGFFGFLIYDLGFFADLFYFLPIDEVNYFFYNIMSIITTLTACCITCVFIVLCIRKFVSKPDIYINYKITYKFKLPKNTLFLLITGLCIIEFSTFLYIFLNFFLDKFFGVAPIPPSEFQLYFPQTGFGIFLYFISLVIIPAFAEEFVCRYIMLNALRKYGNIFAMIVTSVFFGFMHARVSAFIYATAMGFFLAYIAIKTKSVWFPVIMHAVVNSVSFIFQYLYSLPSFEDSGEIIYFIFLSVIAVICFIYLLILIINKKELKLKKPENYIYITNRQKLIFFFNIASIIFFILVILGSIEDYSFKDILKIY